MDYSSPVFIEWVILNCCLAVISVTLCVKHYREKKRMNANLLVSQVI